MEKLFISLYRFLSKRRIAFLTFVALITALLIWVSFSINLREDVSDFMPNDGNAERINFVNNNISLSEKIIISLSNTDTSLYADEGGLFEFADMLADSIMSKGKDDVKDIFYKIDDRQTFNIASFIIRNLPYYLEKSDYDHIDSLLKPEKIQMALAADKKVIVSPAGYAVKRMLSLDPLHLSGKALGRLTSFRVDKIYNIENGYILSKDRKSLFVFVSSVHPVSETALNKRLVKALQKSIREVKKASGGSIRISDFGAVEVAVTNATQIRRDSYFSMLISICLIIILLGLYFKKPAPLYLIVLPVIFGGAFAIALLVLFKGTISSIAVGAGSAIFGIAINYSLHFLVHINEHGGLETSISDLASPMVVGSITTVGAFLSLMILSSEAMHDFGLFAALTLVGTLIFVLIVLPHIIDLLNIAVKKEEGKQPSFWEKIGEFRPENKKYIVLITFILTIILAWFSGSVRFDSDLNQINYMTREQKRSLKELSEFTTLSRQTTYLITEGKTPYDALRNYERNCTELDSLFKEGKIKGYMGVGTGLISDTLQKRKAEQWNRFWEKRKNSAGDNIMKFGKAEGFNDESFKPFLSLADSTITAQPFEHFETLSGSVFSDLLINTKGRSMIVTLVYSDPGRIFDSSVLTSKYPDTFTYDRKNMADSLIRSLVKDFNKVLWICGLIVIVFLTISFGRFELSILAFLPMAISWFWILGIMSIFNISFNVVNIILATFIFGLGDDYSIFIIEGLMKDYSQKTKLLNSYKTAVLLSALTMFIGIGTLIFARHPAMRSLGKVTVIGMTSVVAISFVAAPYLFNVLVKKKGRDRLMPVTFVNLFKTILSFSAFLLGSLLLTIVGFVLLTICRPSQKNKLRFHTWLSKVSHFVVYRLPGVDTKISNPYCEDFKKPAIIICNHQAHIDLVYLLMLSPRIIILTNEWVWNSPFYGKIVRYADFYPVAGGVEQSIGPLSELVNNGYSIVVFPEGTRSEDCSIKRFHKGAFYLAEKLNLDIVPIMIHGMGHCLPKKELYLRKGTCTMKIFDRIKQSDKSFGNDYVERSKNMKRFYSKEYSTMVKQIETAGYFKDRVLHNYIYKGSMVDWQARKTLRKKSTYALINRLPENGRVVFLNAGYGTVTLLSALVKKELIIFAVENDHEKRQLAENCVSKPVNLNYVASVDDIPDYGVQDVTITIEENEAI
jgi:uncharacterized protein